LRNSSAFEYFRSWNASVSVLPASTALKVEVGSWWGFGQVTKCAGTLYGRPKLRLSVCGGAAPVWVRHRSQLLVPTSSALKTLAQPSRTYSKSYVYDSHHNTAAFLTSPSFPLTFPRCKPKD
jgi:hypothetical protein